MNEVTLLPVKPGTLNDDDKAALRDAGVIVIEHDNPAELRLITPCSELNGNDMLRCAMKALLHDDKNYSRGAAQREQFALALAEAIAGAT